MTSFKHMVAAVSVGIALIGLPVLADARIVSHKPVAKHVTRKHALKVHRKHVVKHVIGKSHKPLVGKGLHGKKPLVTKKVGSSKTSAGWQHHPKSV